MPYFVPLSRPCSNFIVAETQRKIFHWLGNLDHTSLQTKGIQLRSHLTEQTGAWFLEGEEFKSWLQTSGANLWLHGIRRYTRHGFFFSAVASLRFKINIHRRWNLGGYSTVASL